MRPISAAAPKRALAVPPTPQPTNTPQELPTFALPTLDTSGAQPTISFEATPTTAGAVTTPLPGFTQVSLSPVPPAATQALGDDCHNSAFEGDVTIADGTIIKGGEDFQKVWKVRNTGSCTWDEGYSFVYIGGSSPDLDPYTFNFTTGSDFVAGGDAINLPIDLTAPCAVGEYSGTWRMRDDAGYFFGEFFSVYITVVEKGSNCP